MTNEHDGYSSYAENYDKSSEESGWYAPEVLFGLMYRHVNLDDTLLDIGVGTGLASVLFEKAGLVIHGIDRSPSMLAQCGRTHPAFTLVEHDLTIAPWPFGKDRFDHAVSTGVTHFLTDLRLVFSEAARIIRTGGTLGFDFAEYSAGIHEGYERHSDGVFTRLDTEYNVRIVRQTADHVFGLLDEIGFDVLHDVDFLVSRERKDYFRAVVARRR